MLDEVLAFIQPFLLLDKNTWLLLRDVFLVLLVTGTARFFQRRFFNKLLSKLEETPLVWDDGVVYGLQKPIGALIWLLGITYAALIVESYAQHDVIFAWIEPVRTLGILVVMGWTILRFIDRTEQNLLHPPKAINKTLNKTFKKFDKTSVAAVSRIIRIAVFITMALITLQTFNIPVSGLLTLGGAGTLVAGIAAKDLLANLFGGLLLSIDRPFSVGDWIRSPDREIEGTVEHIGWRLTQIRTFAKRALYVPNAFFLNMTVENPSRMTNRQIKDIIGVRYQDANKLPVIVEEIEQMLKSHPELDTSHTTFCLLKKFAPSSLDLQLYCFTKTREWVPYLKIQQDVFLRITEIVHKHGADIAFPTTTLDISEGLLTQKE